MNILRFQPQDVRFDFILTTPGGVYEEEALSYGCKIHYAPAIRHFISYQCFLGKVLRAGQYDVLHVHGEEFMGDAMKVAANAGIPGRIAHCHNTQLARGKKGFEMWVRSCRHKTVDRSYLLRYATDIIACSNDSGRFLMGRHWGSDLRCKPLFCGVPLDNFANILIQEARTKFRKAQGIPSDAIVVGHAGSMGPSRQKNHPFIIEVFTELVRRDHRYCLFLAGDGPQHADLVAKVESLGLESRVIMPGLCNNVPALMAHAFDVHLLPSLWEGLPVAGLEAVASGLFTVCSDTITKDFTGYFSNRVSPLSLNCDVKVWADEVMAGVEKRISAQAGVALVEKSPFSIHSSYYALVDLYRNRLKVTGARQA